MNVPYRAPRLPWILAVVTGLMMAGAAACNSGSSLAPSSAGSSGAADAKPGATSAYQLNISHIECTDGGLEVHFVLLHVPPGIPLDQLTVHYQLGGDRSVGAGKNVGNVYHFTDFIPDWNGQVDIVVGSVNVPAAGGNPPKVVALHNPGAYAGVYDCGDPEAECDVPLPLEVQGQEDLFCRPVIAGGPQAECSVFYPGSTAINKDEAPGNPATAITSAALAIIKTGSGQTSCLAGEQAYRLILNVGADDLLPPPTGATSISHVTYCSCPVGGGN